MHHGWGGGAYPPPPHPKKKKKKKLAHSSGHNTAEPYNFILIKVSNILRPKKEEKMNVLENESKWKDNEKEKMKKVASDYNGEEENAEKKKIKKIKARPFISSNKCSWPTRMIPHNKKGKKESISIKKIKCYPKTDNINNTITNSEMQKD